MRDFSYTGHYRQSWAVQNQRWRYQIFIDGSRPPELFHRPDDPYDQQNVIEQHHDVANGMELELWRFVAWTART